MNRNLRLRWLTAIFLLEGMLFLSSFGADVLINAIRYPFHPLGFESARLADLSSHPTLPMVRAQQNFKVLLRYGFENSEALKRWEEKIFKGGTRYEVLEENGGGFLRSKSNNSCSGLYIQTNTPSTPDLYVSWKWRALEFPKKKTPDNISNKSEDDFAARVYVIFPGSNFFKSDVIEYVWDERAPAGTTALSLYSERIKLVILRSGPAPKEEGGWAEEERNVYEDYQKLYGKAPEKPVGAVALMSDSDNTGTSAEADFKDISLKIRQKA